MNLESWHYDRLNPRFKRSWIPECIGETQSVFYHHQQAQDVLLKVRAGNYGGSG